MSKGETNHHKTKEYEMETMTIETKAEPKPKQEVAEQAPPPLERGAFERGAIALGQGKRPAGIHAKAIPACVLDY